MHGAPRSAVAVLLVAACVVLGDAGRARATRTPSAADAAQDTPAPSIRWHACRRGFECGWLTVPVDHGDPTGEQLRVAVKRRPALDPRRRIGSLVVNFGGPGDPGTATLRWFARDVARPVRERYDLVSFDPRGTGRSRPIDCIGDADAARWYDADPTPEQDADLRAFYAGIVGGVDVVQHCVDAHGEWLARVGTRNVAGDVELLRAALGDDTLTFLGFSYGTVIGAVYAQQFPERVGRMVLDAPVDLSDPAGHDDDDDIGAFEDALGAFLLDCARDRGCPFHSGGRSRAALGELRDRFERGATLPVRRPDGRRDPRRAGVAAFYSALVASLYDEELGWPDLALALDRAGDGDGTLLQWIADGWNGRRDDGSYGNLDEALLAIACADDPEPLQSYQDYVVGYRRAAREFPFLGAYGASFPSGCDVRLPRPTDAELLGDVRVSGVPPLLVVATTGDPATPYAGALDFVARVERARLLTFVATEHTAYGKDRCIDDAVNRYLLTGRLPRGTRCRR